MKNKIEIHFTVATDGGCSIALEADLNSVEAKAAILTLLDHKKERTETDALKFNDSRPSGAYPDPSLSVVCRAEDTKYRRWLT